MLTASLTWLLHVRHLISHLTRCRVDSLSHLAPSCAASHFTWEPLIRPVCRLVVLGSSLSTSSDLTCFSASHGGWSCASIRVHHSTHGRCSAQVGSPSSRLACGLLQNLQFSSKLVGQNAQNLCTERLLSLFGRAFATSQGERCPSPVPRFMGVPLSRPLQFTGCSPPQFVRHRPSLSPARCVQAWFQTHATPPLYRSLRNRLVAAASSLSDCHVHGLSLAARTRSSIDAPALLPMLDSGGSLAGVQTLIVVRSVRSLLWRLAPLFVPMLRLLGQWCRECSVHPDSVSFWVRHLWLFLSSSSLNSASLIRPHVSFVGQVC